MGFSSWKFVNGVELVQKVQHSPGFKEAERQSLNQQTNAASLSSSSCSLAFNLGN